MTRENKLALIVGFSLLLVVAILLADHLSPAQQGEMATLGPTTAQGSEIALPPGSGDQYRRQFGAEANLAGGDRGNSREVTLFEPPHRALQIGMNGGTGGSAQPADAGSSPDFEVESGRAEGFGENRSRSGDRPRAVEMGSPVGPVLPPSQDDAPEARPGHRHIIKDGDTLYGLCRTFYSDGSLYEALMKYNRDVVPASGRLQIGMTLVIPGKEVLMGRSSPPPVREQVAPSMAPAPPNVRTIEYTIRENDRLWDIAKKYLGKGGRFHEIVALNRDIIKNPDVLPIGKTIRIPAR